jgi:surface antigen
MRIAVLTGLFACALVFSLGTQTSSAQESNTTTGTNQTNISNEAPTVLALLNTEHAIALKVLMNDELPKEVPAEPTIQKHVVTENETLITIAEKYQMTWRRLFDKNEQISNPDVLEVGQELVVPDPDEQLPERALPEPVVLVQNTAPRTSTKASTAYAQKVTHPVQGTTAGNGYVAGYCTWYVKNKRPDLPNNLGNAATWVIRARAQGIATGSAPAVGAVGQRNNHVVYVESVNADGTVTISEMNYRARYAVTTRTVPANYFSYIY